MVPGETSKAIVLPVMCPTANLAADEPRALCIITDRSSMKNGGNTKIVMNLPLSTITSHLFSEVAQKFQYGPSSFFLVYSQNENTADCGVENEKFVLYSDELTLQDLGFVSGSRNHITIKHKTQVLHFNEFDSTKEAAGADIVRREKICSKNYSDFELDDEAVMGKIPVKELLRRTKISANERLVVKDIAKRFSFDNCSSRERVDERYSNEFVGLVNQAMTCYLNSLLQTLYMTPEFRNALYKWEFDGTEEEGIKSIPFQLQKLFLQLQTSSKPAVGTTELTRSFGWDSSEAWQQHDVQELCRVMFDALEQKFKNTGQSDLISTLYEGKLKDYVKCLECGYESARVDTFLDVPLVVRPFGSSQSYGSVEEALEAFVAPETLDGSNQYFCEQCNKKCDAHKGLKFITFPYLLTLQLKRFDFDPLTMHRIKLNDKVYFPDILKLNDFVKPELPEDNCEDELCSSEINEDIDPPLKTIDEGPYVYDLFSIMVHSGSANGGHYYAYIRSFADYNWYCFNDTNVTDCTFADIQKTYGGGINRGYYSSSYSSSTNAYMLMYRQKNRDKNRDFITQDSFPEHIQALLQCMEEQAKREKIQKELEQFTCKIKLFCQHPIKQMTEMVLTVFKMCTLDEATERAYTIMGLKGLVPPDCVRLVMYDRCLGHIRNSLGNDGDQGMSDLLGGIFDSYKFDLLLEIKNPNQQFREYKPNGITFKVSVVDLEFDNVSPCVTMICLDRNETVQLLKKLVGEFLDVATCDMRLVWEEYENNFILLEEDDANFSDFKKCNKVFVEFRDTEDAKKPFCHSNLYNVIDCHGNIICAEVELPKFDTAYLEELRMEFGEQEPNSDYSSEGEDNGDMDELQMDKKCISGGFSQKPKRSYRYTSDLDFRLAEKVRRYKKSDEDKQQKNGKQEVKVDAMGNLHSTDFHARDSAQGCSDQSEDSYTDSERTLVGDSPRNNSPDASFGEMEQDMAECDSQMNGQVQNECRNMSSPEENSNCDNNYRKKRCNFRVHPFNDPDTGNKMLRVFVDKRLTFAEFKKELEPYVNMKAETFKISKVTSSTKSTEFIKITKQLLEYSEGSNSTLSIKLQQMLRKGEHRVKLYQFCLNDAEPIKFLMECILVKGMPILKIKKLILPLLKEQCNLDVPLNRCRLRLKNISWASVDQILLDEHVFDFADLTLSELLLEVLPDAEPMTSSHQHPVFTRFWRPSEFILDPFKEIILENKSTECLLKQLSKLSDVPPEYISIAKVPCCFPFEINLLHLHTKLDWCAGTTKPNVLCTEDSVIILYRDDRESLKELSEEEQRVITNRENARTNRNSKNYYSPRKEKALKIYTAETTPRVQTNIDLD